jgi:hypothetical protein
MRQSSPLDRKLTSLQSGLPNKAAMQAGGASSVSAIARDLHERGIATPRGRPLAT